jgi:uncharacterized membrane protein (UPF0127 family)
MFYYSIMKKLLLFLLISLAALSCQRLPMVHDNTPYTHKLQVNNKILMVEVVKDDSAIAKGLSGREKLGADEGMLFDYGNSTSVVPGFWMPDMKFDLDLIWIKNKKIIAITPNVPCPQSPSAPACGRQAAPKSANDNLPLYYPPSPVDQVLEVNAGWSEKNNIKVGDEMGGQN